MYKGHTRFLQDNRLVIISLALYLALTVSACVREPEPTANAKQITDEVRGVMETQQAAWNRGDIEGFMEGYDHADATTFVSGEELIRGWQIVFERYKRQYGRHGQCKI